MSSLTILGIVLGTVGIVALAIVAIFAITKDRDFSGQIDRKKFTLDVRSEDSGARESNS